MTDAAHGHAGHGRPPGPVRGAGVLRLVALLLIVATAIGMVLLRPGDDRVVADLPDRGDRVQGTVVRISSASCSLGAVDVPPVEGDDQGCVVLDLRIDEGPDAGQVVVLLEGLDVRTEPRTGQRLVLIRSGDDVPLDGRYQVIDVERGRALLALAVVFALSVVALGRWRGALALVGLGVSLLVVVGWLVPALLAGRPPLLTAVVGASAVMVVALVLSHGPSLRTVVALLGTAASLLLIIGLSTLFVELAGLTGLTSDEVVYVRTYFPGVDVRGLLLAGIVIGALGILDDVTVTQVSTVWELRAVDPAMPGRALYAAALRVGRDHIASTVNTLLLAYAGASLPLLVIFATAGDGVVDVLTTGVIGQEIVRTLAGSVGLVAAVPITTALAAFVCPASAGTRVARSRHDRPGDASG